MNDVDDPIVCVCARVGEDALMRVIREGARTVAEVRNRCRTSRGCGSCTADIEDLIEAVERAPS
jgi:NAD(P)H-nitrite reductase large subunit